MCQSAAPHVRSYAVWPLPIQLILIPTALTFFIWGVLHMAKTSIADSAVLTKRDAKNAANIAANSEYWPQITTKDQIPGWLRDNNFIVSGHPMPTYSYRKSFRLWRCLHMETMNIWTHALGSSATIAVGLGLYSIAKSNPILSLSADDKLAFGVSTTTAALCFGLSATFHTLRSHSYQVHHFWGRMDIFGICLLAFGGGTSASCYAWFCDRKVRNIYLGINAGSALAAAYTLFDTGGGGTKMRTVRGLTFILLAISSLLPIYHRVGVLGWDAACLQFGAQWYVAEALSLLTGVTLFVTRMPERLKPGTFDIFGHSHQLHHIFAVIGTGFHICALLTGYKYRQAFPAC